MTFQEGNTIWLGRKHTNKTKEKISKAKRGSKMSAKSREKMRQAALSRYRQKDNHPMFGKKHSLEARKKMSLARIGRIPWNIGKKYGKETRKKISEANKKRFKNPENHPRWKGGVKYKPDGRVLIYKKSHPSADSQGYVRRSHLVMEEKIGRYLTKEEIVHHIDGDQTNDSLDNLQLLANGKEHAQLHGKLDTHPFKNR